MPDRMSEDMPDRMSEDMPEDMHGVLIQQAYVAAKTHAARSKGPIDPKDTAGYHPLPDELPTVPPELTSGLLHCLSTLNHPGEIGHHQ